MKRIFDITVALSGLLLLLPLMIAIAVAVRLNVGSPVFFRQRRPGRHGVAFTLVKFRTMREATDDLGRGVPDSERLTEFGKYLRRTSLDELPELLNVLKGEMSLVGPRPLLVEYLPLYTPEQARRHEIRPGITGWAQVNGRNAVDWEERFRLDLWYIDNRTFLLDLFILGRTAASVFRARGISQPGHATMERFKGGQS